jgi:CubicO group peptidase (beta-lactamase class C family)
MDSVHRLGLLLITAVLLSILLGCEPESRPEADAGPVSASALVGLWQGFVYFELREFRVEIEISQNSEGELAGVADFRDSGSLGVPLKVELADDTVILSTGSGSLFEGRLLDDLRAIHGELFAATRGTWYTLTLEKDNEKFRRFSQPRLTEAGTVQREYSYQPPSDGEGEWPVSTLSSEAINEGQIESLIESVLRGEQGRPEAILVARDGKLVLEEYFYGFSRDRIHSIQSITKSVTSLLFGIAMDAGLVGDLDQLVYSFFPEYLGKKWIDRKSPITLAHLLNMSAAIEWKTEGHESLTAMYRSGDWIGYVLNLDQADVPGEAASYNSGLSILLGGVIRNTTGKFVDKFAEETLFADLQVSKYRWLAASDGTRNTSGGLILSAYDLAKLGQLVLSKGRWNGKQVVSEAWITESTKRHLPLGEESVRSTGDSPYSVSYGYQWWHQRYNVDGVPIHAIAGLGYGGQYLGIFPTLNTVVVLNNGEWGMPWERVFDYNVIVEEWILPAIR